MHKPWAPLAQLDDAGLNFCKPASFEHTLNKQIHQHTHTCPMTVFSAHGAPTSTRRRRWPTAACCSRSRCPERSRILRCSAKTPAARSPACSTCICRCACMCAYLWTRATAVAGSCRDSIWRTAGAQRPSPVVLRWWPEQNWHAAPSAGQAMHTHSVQLRAPARTRGGR